MHYLIKKLDNLKSHKFLDTLLTKVGDVRPMRKKRSWSERKILQNHFLEIREMVSIGHEHCSMTNHKEEEIRKIHIKKWDGKEFRLLVSADVVKDVAKINEYTNGLYEYQGNYKRVFIDNDHTYEVMYTMFGGYELIELFTCGKREKTILSHFGNIRLFLDFDRKRENVCYQCFPISETEEGKISLEFVGLMATLALVVGAMYWYFQSLPLVALVVGISFSALSMSEVVNPQQKSILKIIQIIIYGIALVFLR